MIQTKSTVVPRCRWRPSRACLRFRGRAPLGSIPAASRHSPSRFLTRRQACIAFGSRTAMATVTQRPLPSPDLDRVEPRLVGLLLNVAHDRSAAQEEEEVAIPPSNGPIPNQSAKPNEIVAWVAPARTHAGALIVMRIVSLCGSISQLSWDRSARRRLYGCRIPVVARITCRSNFDLPCRRHSCSCQTSTRTNRRFPRRWSHPTRR